MQRWDFGPHDSMMVPLADGRFYVASAVDARIAELEKCGNGANCCAQAARIEELEKSHQRYETLRRLNPQEFTGLYRLNIQRGTPFDDLVDGLTRGL